MCETQTWAGSNETAKLLRRPCHFHGTVCLKPLFQVLFRPHLKRLQKEHSFQVAHPPGHGCLVQGEALTEIRAMGTTPWTQERESQSHSLSGCLDYKTSTCFTETWNNHIEPKNTAQIQPGIFQCVAHTFILFFLNKTLMAHGVVGRPLGIASAAL